MRWRETLSKVKASWRRRRGALGERIELPLEGKDGLRWVPWSQWMV